jgi:hypothetical protein
MKLTDEQIEFLYLEKFFDKEDEGYTFRDIARAVEELINELR